MNLCKFCSSDVCAHEQNILFTQEFSDGHVNEVTSTYFHFSKNQQGSVLSRKCPQDEKGMFLLEDVQLCNWSSRECLLQCDGIFWGGVCMSGSVMAN